MIITTTKTMRPRDQHDHYPTPISLCAAAFDALPSWVEPVSILDPGAGTGPWGVAARQRWPEATIAGLELRDNAVNPGAYDLWWTGYDFLRCREQGPGFDLIIGNPPYKHAEAFVRRSLALLRPLGHLLFLLRLAFLESDERAKGLWREYMPATVDTLAQRPSYTGDGKTDATAYAVFIWQQGYSPRRYLGGVLDWKHRDAPQQLALVAA